MSRTRYKLDIKRNPSFTLNITSMTDMFTILLVFLLQTFASAEVPIDMVADLRLPSSTTEKNPVQGVQIAITQKELLFEHGSMTSIQDHDFSKASLDPNDSQFIKPLFDKLSAINKDPKRKSEAKQILLQADQDTPYTLIRKVMYTASMAGFPKVKLMTTVGE